MKDIITGFCLLITVPSVIYFWFVFIFLEESKQINLSNFDNKNLKKNIKRK